MRTIWHSLLWKEWHEHKWKLAALMAILVTAQFVFGYSDLDLSMLRGMLPTLLFYCVLAGTFLGMSTAGGESGRKTLPFLQSLPAPMWQPGITKLMIAILTAVLPVLVLAAVFYGWWTLQNWPGKAELQFEGRLWSVTDLVAIGTLGATLGVSSLVLWMAAAGLNRCDEIRAGAVGFLTLCIIWFAFAYCYNQAEKRHLQTVQHGIEILFAAAPGGVWSVGPNTRFQSSMYLPFIFSAVIGHGCVLAWYLRRFGRVVAKPARTEGNVSPLALSKNQQLGPPRRSQLTAIAWKQARETAPLALVAVGGIFVMATVVYLYSYRLMIATEFGEVLGGATLGMAFFVTIVAGIGVFLEDLKPRVEDFWRSRPIHLTLWFGVKFVVGIAVLAAAFAAMLLLAYWLTDGGPLRREPHPLVEVGYVSWVFLLIYTLSMATYCIVRQPLYAAVLTIGLFVAGINVLGWFSYHFFQNPFHWAVSAALMLLLQAIVTTLAWLAVRYNLGYKG